MHSLSLTEKKLWPAAFVGGQLYRLACNRRKNLPRMPPLTLELLQYGFPVILVLNMMDEAEKAGVRIVQAVVQTAGDPVVQTS